MAKPKRKSPGVGRGHNAILATPADIDAALAVQILFGEKIDAIKQSMKAARKGFEAKHVRLDKIDMLVKMKDMDPAEIVDEMKLDFHYISVVHTEIGQNYDLFSQKNGDLVTRNAARHHGKMAGFKGEPASPPPNVTGNDRNDWLEGHKEGADARAKGEDTVAEFLASAMQIAEKGGVVDGTKTGADGKAQEAPKGPPTTVEKIRTEARETFEADNPGVNKPPEPSDDPLVFNGVRYPNKTRADAARKAHADEAAAAAKAANAGGAEAAKEPASFQEDKAEDLAKQTTRKVVQGKKSQSQIAAEKRAEAGAV